MDAGGNRFSIGEMMRSNWIEANSAQNFFEEVARDGNTLLAGGGACTKCRFCSFAQTGPLIRTKYTSEWVTPEIFSKCIDLLDRKKAVYLDVSSGEMNWVEDRSIWPSSREIFEHPESEKLFGILNEKTVGIKKFIFTGAFDYRDSFKSFITNDYMMVLSLLSIDSEDRSKFRTSSNQEIEVENIKSFMKGNVDKLIGVVIPWTGNMDAYKKTIDYVLNNVNPLTTIWLQQLSYTKYSDPRIISIASEADSKYEVAYDYFMKQFSQRSTCYTLAAWVRNEESRNDFSSRIDSALKYLQEKNIQLSDVGFIGNEIFLQNIKNPYPELNWIYYTNDYFGGNIIAYGLIPFRDIELAIEKYSRKFSYYIVSRNIFIWMRIEKRFKDVDVLCEKSNSKYNFLYF
jgi:hypothetical protein